MIASQSLSSLGSCREPATNSPLLCPIVAFDGGNRSLQWVDPVGRVCQIPSFIKTIDPAWEDVQPSERSIVIEFEGETFVLGQAAKDLSGIPVFADDKVQLARKLVLAALQPNPGETALRVERLVVALPNARNSSDTSLLKQIEGTYEFTRNGQQLIATVRTVQPIDETLAAYRFAVRQGLFLSKQNLNGVMDLGGGTSILRLYGTDGNLMREADVILPGTADLARKVAAKITRELSGSPDLTLVMDGVERGDFQLGTTGFCFEQAFEKSRDEWIEEMRAAIRTRWSKWLPSLGEVLIIGGSAPLAAPFAIASKGRFKIAPNPQTISIVGMLGV